ncbi:unnamed protein product, partial [Rhizoctonia solani]
SHSESLLFVTEVCYCQNFLQLPYVLEWDGTEARWKETDYFSTFKKTSNDIVHFAATSPGESAMSFGIGSVFTKAFCNIDPKKELSLEAILEQLQGNINEVLSKEPQLEPQNPKIYSSRIINDPHFFAGQGFFLPTSPTGTDYDSSR